MRFLGDMGLAQSTLVWLRNKGYDAIHLREEGLHRLSDTDITEKARQEDRIIITFDLDFGDIMAATGKTTPSVIILRLDDQRPQRVNCRLKQVLADSSESLLKGAIISVDENRHRVRLLPIGEGDR